MDAKGATALQLRIEQQQHWERATAVRDGKQPSIDPDSYRLVELRSAERVYRGDGDAVFVKRLADGVWCIEVDAPEAVC
jgi:hypothetical protein